MPMSRIAVVLLVAALLSMAPGVALGNDVQESSSQTSAAQSEEALSCAGSGEATPTGKAGYCPTRSQTAGSETPGALEMPVYIPPSRGSPPTRIGGANRGGARPIRKI